MIEVYAVKIPERVDNFMMAELLKHVEPTKRRKVLRFRREEDRIRSLFADLLVRQTIMQKTGLRNEEIFFGTNEFGKPYLKGRNDFHFNVSHSGIWVVAAVDSQPVGVDVEQVDDVDLSISRDFFSDDEHSDLMSKNDKVSYFFTLWTLKESYIKIIGKGLSLPLNSFTVRFEDQDGIVLNCPKGKPIEGISFAQYHIHKDYKMVLCASHNRLPSDVTMQNTGRLIDRFIA